MCYRVECGHCGKYTWGGCGSHLSTLYNSIETGRHCTCRTWPGVVIRPAHSSTTAHAKPTPSGTSAPASTSTGTAKS